MEIVDADWLRQRLQATGITQVRLAEAMGIEPHMLSKILKGKRRVQTVEAARARSFFGLDRLSAEEEELLQAWRNAPEHRREAAVELLKFLATRSESE